MKMLLFLVALSTCGCATTRSLVLDGTPAPHERDRLEAGRRIRIEGYITRDGTDHPLRGFVDRAGDSLRFWRPVMKSGIRVEGMQRIRTLPVSDITELKVLRPARTRTLMALGVLPVLGLVVVWVVAVNSPGKTVF